MATSIFTLNFYALENLNNSLKNAQKRSKIFTPTNYTVSGVSTGTSIA